MRKRYSGEAMESMPDPEWLIPGVLPANAVSLLFAPSGIGKSFLSLDMGLCVATATAWGQREVSRGGVVVYVATEGGSGYKSRKRAWEQFYGVPMVRDSFQLIPEDVQLLQDADVRAFIDELREIERECGPIALVVFDTLSACMEAGASPNGQNSSNDMAGVVAAGRRIQAATGGAGVLFVHHQGPQGDARGAKALMLGSDMVMQLEVVGRRSNKTQDSIQAGDTVQLICKRPRDSAKFEPLSFTAREVAGSLVLAHGGAVASPLPKRTVRPKLPPAEMQTLRACERLVEQGQPITPANVAPLIRKTNDATRRRLRRLAERENGRYLVRVSGGLYELPPDRMPDSMSAVLSGVEVA